MKGQNLRRLYAEKLTIFTQNQDLDISKIGHACHAARLSLVGERMRSREYVFYEMLYNTTVTFPDTYTRNKRCNLSCIASALLCASQRHRDKLL